MKRLATLITLLCLLTANAFAQDKQFLYVKFTPEDATLEINGEVKATTGGEYHELLPLGEHTYKLYKDGYTATSGTVRIADRYQTQNLELSLKQPIAFISISNKQNLSGALVYIDDTFVGELPVNNFQVSSGSHILAIKHPLHKTHTSLFRLADEESKTLSPSLIRSHVIVTIESSELSDIFVNNELIGKGSCKDTLVIGNNYKFESRLPSHTPNPLYCTIGLNDDNRIIKLPNPTPIYGGLKISSTLPDAKIYLDGIFIGNTPCRAKQILVGEHTVSMKYNDYKSSKSVIISKGEDAEVYFELPHGSLSLTSSPSQAQIFINDTLVGTTPKYIPEIWPGEYTVAFVYNNNWLKSKKFTIFIEDGEFEEVSVNKALGSLNITSKPSNAKVELDEIEIEIGTTPISIPEILAGEYTLTLTYPSGIKERQIVNVCEGEETNIYHEEAHCSLFVSSNINELCLLIDDKLVGSVPMAVLEIPAGKHTISILSLSSGKSEPKALDLKPNENLMVHFEVKEEGEALQIDITQTTIIEPSDTTIPVNFTEIIYSDFFKDKIEPAEITLIKYQDTFKDAIPFQLVEEKPSFQGGDANQFSKWVNQRLVYPEIAKENGVQGRVTLQFTVEKDGRITNVKVLRGVDPSLDKEAVRVVSSSPKWTPGKQRNRAVPVTYTFPVIFQLR